MPACCGTSFDIKRWLPFLFAFVLPLLVIYIWWGGFAPITITEEVRGPWLYAYVDHVGDYAKLTDSQGIARTAMERQKIAYGDSFTLLEVDPRGTPKADLRARIGFLLNTPVVVQAPLKLDTIPARRVLVVRLRASLFMAPSRAYQALHDKLAAQGKTIRMPTVEIYHPADSIWKMGEFTLEMAQP